MGGLSEIDIGQYKLRRVTGLIRKLVKKMLGPRLANAQFLLAAPLAYPPGHFYSPICDPTDLKQHYRDPSTTIPPSVLPGIDLALAGPGRIMGKLGGILRRCSPSGRERPVPALSFFPASSYRGECHNLVVMLLHLRPARLIEVGSGSSSAIALDTLLTARISPHVPNAASSSPTRLS